MIGLNTQMGWNKQNMYNKNGPFRIKYNAFETKSTQQYTYKRISIIFTLLSSVAYTLIKSPE